MTRSLAHGCPVCHGPVTLLPDPDTPRTPDQGLTPVALAVLCDRCDYGASHAQYARRTPAMATRVTPPRLD